MESLLLLFGVWLVLQNLAYVIWTGDTQSILTSYTLKSVSLFGVRVGVPALVFAVRVSRSSSSSSSCKGRTSERRSAPSPRTATRRFSRA